MSRKAKRLPAATRSGSSRSNKSTLSHRTRVAKKKGLSAINRVRKGESPNITAAARAERTTVRSIQRLLSAALIQDHKGGRIRVKAGDSYSQPVEILTKHGPVVVSARGSRERDLAGQHRTIYIRVLRNQLPGSALEQFRGKRVGGQSLVSDFAQLSVLAQAGVIDHLSALYVSPETGV